MSTRNFRVSHICHTCLWPTFFCDSPVIFVWLLPATHLCDTFLPPLWHIPVTTTVTLLASTSVTLICNHCDHTCHISTTSVTFQPPLSHFNHACHTSTATTSVTYFCNYCDPSLWPICDCQIIWLVCPWCQGNYMLDDIAFSQKGDMLFCPHFFKYFAFFSLRQE